MNYDHNKKFGLLKFHSGYGKFNLNNPKGYSLKIINVQTASGRWQLKTQGKSDSLQHIYCVFYNIRYDL